MIDVSTLKPGDILYEMNNDLSGDDMPNDVDDAVTTYVVVRLYDEELYVVRLEYPPCCRVSKPDGKSANIERSIQPESLKSIEDTFYRSHKECVLANAQEYENFGKGYIRVANRLRELAGNLQEGS